MRIRLFSDLHLEFYTNVSKLQRQILRNIEDSLEDEVLVLAGDIGYPLTRKHRINQNYVELLRQLRSRWKHVLLVSGNHEYYPCSDVIPFSYVESCIRDICTELDVHYLQKDSLVIEGIRFLGTTLWSAITATAFQQMNDRFIFPSYHHYRDLHKEQLQWLQEELPKSGLPTIVITHHLPSYQLIHPKYHDEVTNSAYATNLEALIASRECIKLWCCGHTHEKSSLQLGSTRIVTNPYGYPGEKRETTFTPETYSICHVTSGTGDFCLTNT